MNRHFSFPENLTVEQVELIYDFLTAVAHGLMDQYDPQFAEHYERPHPDDLLYDDQEAHGTTDPVNNSRRSLGDFDEIPY